MNLHLSDKTPSPGSERKIYAILSTFMLVYFFSWATTLGTYSFWLSEKIGLNGIQIGTVFAINGVVAVVIKPFYGFIIDRLGIRKNLLLFIAVLSVFIFPFFFFIYTPLLSRSLSLGVIPGALFLSFGYYAGCAAAESSMDRFGRLYELEFGRIRMWGAVGSALAAACSGMLFNVNPQFNFALSSFGAVVALILIVLLKIDASEDAKSRVMAKEKTTVQDVFHLFRLRKFWAFVIYVCGIVWVLFVAEQQYPRFFITFYADKQTGHDMFGWLGSLSLGIEFLCMMIAPTIVNRMGPKFGMLVTGSVVACRFILSGVVTSALAIGIIKLSWGLEMSFLLVSVFKYLEINFDKKINGTMYLLGYQCVNYIGTVLLSPLAGVLYEKIGFAHAYLLMGCIVGIFTILSAFLLKNNLTPVSEMATRVSQQ